MIYFRKRQIGRETYVYRIEKLGRNNTSTEYLGNIKNISGDLLSEIDEYFQKRELRKLLKDPHQYAEYIKENFFPSYKKFGDMWLINEFEKEIKLRELINSKVIIRDKKTIASPGMFFLIAIINRLIEPLSKNKISDWLSEYDVDHIFEEKINPKDFTSANFCKQFNKITESKLEEISNDFLKHCCTLANVSSKNKTASFDTTNFFSYIASETSSELFKAGKNKQGRDNLRQVGLSFLIDNEKEMILHFKIYTGNIHDSKLFKQIFPQMLAQARKCGKKEVIFDFDKGINSPETIADIDNEENAHFITSYSPSNAPDLMSITLDNFRIVDCKHNQKIDDEIKRNPTKSKLLEMRKVVAYSTTREFWGAKRKVVVIYNNETAKKQKYRFDKNINKLKNWLDEAKKRVKDKVPYYTTKSSVIRLYKKAATDCHLNSDLFELTFLENDNLKLTYCKKETFIKDYVRNFGKSIIITDILTLSDTDCVQMFFDRYVVEKAFRQTKDHSCGCVWPIHHRKDLNVMNHIFCCVAAFTFLRLIELRLKDSNIYKTGSYIINKMKKILMSETSFVNQDLSIDKRFKLTNVDKEHQQIFDLLKYSFENFALKHKS